MKFNATNKRTIIYLYHIYSPVCFLDCRSQEVSICLLQHPPGGRSLLRSDVPRPCNQPCDPLSSDLLLWTDQCLKCLGIPPNTVTIKMTTTQALMFTHSAQQSDPSEDDTICVWCQELRIKSVNICQTQRSSNQRRAHSSQSHNIEHTNTNGLKRLFFSYPPISATCVFWPESLCHWAGVVDKRGAHIF